MCLCPRGRAKIQLMAEERGATNTPGKKDWLMHDSDRERLAFFLGQVKTEVHRGCSVSACALGGGRSGRAGAGVGPV